MVYGEEHQRGSKWTYFVKILNKNCFAFEWVLVDVLSKWDRKKWKCHDKGIQKVNNKKAKTDIILHHQLGCQLKKCA